MELSTKCELKRPHPRAEGGEAVRFVKIHLNENNDVFVNFDHVEFVYFEKDKQGNYARAIIYMADGRGNSSLATTDIDTVMKAIRND